MNYLANQIIMVFNENTKLDSVYIESETEHLKTLDRFETMLYMTNLDKKNLGALAQKIGCSLDEISVFLDVLRKL